ncbi:MAG TPA: hypothetical protein VFS21_31090 [Roseiflexaceae bacterium]|nr:hypothetical protein [Roseiflexaceae bacterium]
MPLIEETEQPSAPPPQRVAPRRARVNSSGAVASTDFLEGLLQKPVMPARPRFVAQPTSRYEVYASIGAEGVMLLLALGLWLLNAKFTIDALLLIGIAWPFGVLAAIAITLVEQYLWKQHPDALIVVIVLIVSLVDVLTSLVGVTPVLAQQLPFAAQGVQTNPLTWLAGEAIRPFHVVCVALAGLIAVAPEPLVRYFWRRLQNAWHNR